MTTLDDSMTTLDLGGVDDLMTLREGENAQMFRTSVDVSNDKHQHSHNR